MTVCIHFEKLRQHIKCKPTGKKNQVLEQGIELRNACLDASDIIS